MFYYSQNGISAETAIAQFPTLAAVAPHASRSDKYAMISTADVMRSLASQGLQVHGVQTARVRDETKRGFEKHIVRMRHVDTVARDAAPEIALIASHDGSCSFKALSGIIRFICTNGIIAGSNFESVTIPHRGDILDRVINGVHHVSEGFSNLNARIDAYKAKLLTVDQMREFAARALLVRYGDAAKDITPLRNAGMLSLKRREDFGNDLWRVFNVAQENAIKGGARFVTNPGTPDSRRMTARAVTGIDETVRINRAMFDLADEFLTA